LLAVFCLDQRYLLQNTVLVSRYYLRRMKYSFYMFLYLSVASGLANDDIVNNPGLRYGNCAVAWNNTMYILGGDYDFNTYPDFVGTQLPINISSTISWITTLPQPIRSNHGNIHMACEVVGDELFAFGKTGLSIFNFIDNE